jgi:putative thioredoxin
VDVTVETFDEQVLERSNELPVVVDFWAEWCGPCRTLGPVLDRETEARKGDVVLAKVDVDSNQELAQRYGVQGIPAVKAFRNGRVVDEFVGVRSPTLVADFFDRLTGPTPRERLVAELRESRELPDVLAALDSGDDEQALKLLTEAVVAAAGDERKRLLAQTVDLFSELGHEHPLTMRYRRRLAASLY